MARDAALGWTDVADDCGARDLVRPVRVIPAAQRVIRKLNHTLDAGLHKKSLGHQSRTTNVNRP